KVNWLIVKPDTAAQPTKEDTAKPFEFALSRIAIQKAHIRYKDDSSDIFLVAQNFNFLGKGDFAATTYDLATQTRISELSLQMQRASYLKKVSLDADITLNINNAKQEYAFRENKIVINDFECNFDGFVKRMGNKIYTDLKFNTIKTDFKNLLSLIPEIYTRDYSKIKTQGAFQLQGWCKGKLDSTSYPAFNVNLVVSKGFLQYPDLPAPIKNIDIDLQVSNSTPSLENLQIHLRKLHAELENNPIDAQFNLIGLSSPYLEGEAKIRADLAKLTRIFPIQDTQLQGQLNAQASVKGKVAENTLPIFNTQLDLKYGYIKHTSFPAALENIAIAAILNCPTGKREDVTINISNFHAELDKEPIEAKLELQNIIDPAYQLYLHGNIDLEKLNRIYPIEGTQMKGQIIADLKTEGKVSALQNAQYAQLPSSGYIQIRNLFYQSQSLAKPLELNRADLNFTPKHIQLSECSGKIGSSDFWLEGKIENYIGYLFANQILAGNLQLNSQKINLNEFMTSESTQDPTTGDTTALSAPELPANINFLFASSIKELVYDNWEIQNFKGSLLLENKMLSLVGLKFNLWGASIQADGKYDGKQTYKPHVNFNFAIDSMRIKDMFYAFRSAKAYAPILKDINGTLSCAFTYASDLTRNLVPDYATLASIGKAKIQKADITQAAIIQQLHKTTKLAFFQQLKSISQEIGFKIINGRLYVEPFTIRVQDANMNVSGSNGLDKSLDYTLQLDIPTPSVTAQAFHSLSQLAGKKIEAPQRLQLTLSIVGNMDTPQIHIQRIGGAGTANVVASTTEDLKNKAKAEAEAQLLRQRQEAEEKARQEFERLQKETQEKLREAEERKRQELEQARQEAERKAQQEAEKKKQELENKAKEEGKKLREKIKFPPH
ncbi:MAG: AsmA-like C-terminal region-containing protein, partial [Bacteroidia bacterium]|nr:AsmA-like C-terminal region-containing protein [Bacteroidia bacterium]